MTQTQTTANDVSPPRLARLPRRLPQLALLAFLLALPLLAACSRPAPGQPRVWPAQSVSPNVQARSGDVVKLTIRATNDSSDRNYGMAGKVRTHTAYPEGLTLLDFTSSDVGRLAGDDPRHAWVEDVDIKNRVVVVSFGPIDAAEFKTATLIFRVDAAPGSALIFRTMLAWANAGPDSIECDQDCVDEQVRQAGEKDAQIASYIADHEAEVRALIQTYPGGGDALANAVDLTVGEAPISATAPRHALLVGQREQRGLRLSAGPIFTPGEPVMLWYNQPDGTAVFMVRTDAADDGHIDWTLDTAAWEAIPPTATSIVARGQFSSVEALYLFNR